jgi:hypothetical protein
MVVSYGPAAGAACPLEAPVVVAFDQRAQRTHDSRSVVQGTVYPMRVQKPIFGSSWPESDQLLVISSSYLVIGEAER